MITIGIDPHKSSLTAVALQPSGEVAATIRLEVTSDTVPRLRAWAIRWTQRQWAVEGAAGLGRPGSDPDTAGSHQDRPLPDCSCQICVRTPAGIQDPKCR